MSVATETATANGGVHGIYTIPEFALTSGRVIKDMHIAYTTYGDWDSNNLILLLPGTGNTRHGIAGHIGVGKAFDPSRYCIISVDAIGGGDSSKPGDGLLGDFPSYNIKDMVRAQYQLVFHGLGLEDRPLAAVGGASMGAFQSLQWTVDYPGATKRAILMVPATQAGQLFRQTVAQMKRIIALDANWNDGQYRIQPKAGLGTAGKHYFPWTVTDHYLETSPSEVLKADYEAAAKNFMSWDAWSLIRRYEASSAFDLAHGVEGGLSYALSRIQAKLLILPCAQDRLLGVQSARQLAQQVKGADYAEIHSHLGHLSWRPIEGSPQTTFITKSISSWLS